MCRLGSCYRHCELLDPVACLSHSVASVPVDLCVWQKSRSEVATTRPPLPFVTAVQTIGHLITKVTDICLVEEEYNSLSRSQKKTKKSTLEFHGNVCDSRESNPDLSIGNATS